MFTKIKKLSLYILSISILAPVAVARAKGGTDGGGGSAINCEPRIEISTATVDGEIKFVLNFNQKQADKIALSNGRRHQLTDLWEAENGYGPFRKHKLKMFFDDKMSVNKQIERAVSRLSQVNPKFAQVVTDYLKIVRFNIISISEGDEVLPPNDTDIRYLKSGCRLVGLGAYSDRENNLVIDSKIWKTLSRTDRAAFFIHETIYKALRDLENANSSWRTRQMVGFLFSTESFSWEEMSK